MESTLSDWRSEEDQGHALWACKCDTSTFYLGCAPLNRRGGGRGSHHFAVFKIWPSGCGGSFSPLFLFWGGQADARRGGTGGFIPSRRESAARVGLGWDMHAIIERHILINISGGEGKKCVGSVGIVNQGKHDGLGS
jgi:hypothetical protein